MALKWCEACGERAKKWRNKRWACGVCLRVTVYIFECAIVEWNRICREAK